MHNGQFYEAKLPIRHCPSNSGCRSVVKQTNGNIAFTLTENFMLTIKVKIKNFTGVSFVERCIFDVLTVWVAGV